jgi:hypothetical protein
MWGSEFFKLSNQLVMTVGVREPRLSILKAVIRIVRGFLDTMIARRDTFRIKAEAGTSCFGGFHRHQILQALKHLYRVLVE